jgi:hypothetical protein
LCSDDEPERSPYPIQITSPGETATKQDFLAITEATQQMCMITPSFNSASPNLKNKSEKKESGPINNSFHNKAMKSKLGQEAIENF